MLCLTNSRKQFGASLILHDDILRRAGEVLGSNYFVLPSSIHETILVPDIEGSDAQGLCLMVKEINEGKVEAWEQLSDKVQYYPNLPKLLYIGFKLNPKSLIKSVLDPSFSLQIYV